MAVREILLFRRQNSGTVACYNRSLQGKLAQYHFTSKTVKRELLRKLRHLYYNDPIL